MTRAETVRCPDCRAENRARAIFCASCGARLGRARGSQRHGGPAAPTAAPTVAPTLPAATRRIRGWMASFDFDLNGESFVLRHGRNVVGRDPRACDVFLAGDPRVSRQHCLIVGDEAGVHVHDTGSNHGTTLNGQPVGAEPVPLSDGDLLGVCGYALTVKLLP
ncbi:MAG: FHA domain-containing protein [Alphaproteobacteria bacterium]|nr:FHA domain-containing protein [Alphaproteobacteria bacterium]